MTEYNIKAGHYPRNGLINITRKVHKIKDTLVLYVDEN
jgi:hypothetical protein